LQDYIDCFTIMKPITILVAATSLALTAAVAIVPKQALPDKSGAEASVDAAATRWLDHDWYKYVVSLS
jgi:hypothetical protein